jgi:hypothetical protein
MSSSRRPVAPPSTLICANAGPQAIGSVTRVSRRVEFIEAEFNGIGARSPYILHQGIRIGCSKQIARSPDSTLASRSVINSSRPTLVCNRSKKGESKMITFKALAATVLLSATAATPAFAQAPADASLYAQNLRDSGYNPRNDYNPNGTMRAAIQEPGAFAFYYPNLDVLNGGAPTPAARLSPNWPALKGACASAGGGITYCGGR